MKINFITTMAGHVWGGSEELWAKLAHDALDQNHTVTCSIFNWGKLPAKTQALKERGAHIHLRHRFIYPQLHKKLGGKIIQYTLAEKQLNQSLANKDFSLISMGGFCDLEVDAFRRPLLKTKTKFSLIIHVNPEDYYLNTLKIPEIIQVCEKAQKVYFVSNRLLEIAIRQTGYSFPNGELIVNPVNMPETGILPYPTTDTLQFACVGRLDAKVKGHAILLQCLAADKWKKRNWHLNIYGTGNDLNYFQLLTHNFGLQDRVTFQGFTHDVRDDIWAKNHLLLMPSYYEGMPIALIEAMLSGRTAVVTDVGGNAEVLTQGETGFISPGVNAGSYDKALEEAWQNKERWQVMGERAYNDANNYFFKSNHAKDLNDILDGIPFN